METFDYLYRKLTQATVATLMASLALFGLTLLCAVLGFRTLVATLNSVTLAVAFVFGSLFVLFLLTSLVRALVGFLVNRSRSTPG